MKVIVMTSPTFFEEEDKILSALFEEGMDALHLNKPNAAPIYCERLLTLLPVESYDAITVHCHFYLKEEYGLRGIHIDNATEAPPQGYKGHLTRTCSLADDIQEAKRQCDYVLLRDTFAPTPDAARMSLLEEASLQGVIDKHVYAMGGITLSTIEAAKSLGFGGVVVRDDLWGMFDIHRQTDYRGLLGHFAQMRKAAL